MVAACTARALIQVLFCSRCFAYLAHIILLCRRESWPKDILKRLEYSLSFNETSGRNLFVPRWLSKITWYHRTKLKPSHICCGQMKRGIAQTCVCIRLRQLTKTEQYFIFKSESSFDCSRHGRFWNQLAQFISNPGRFVFSGQGTISNTTNHFISYAFVYTLSILQQWFLPEHRLSKPWIVINTRIIKALIVNWQRHPTNSK